MKKCSSCVYYDYRSHGGGKCYLLPPVIVVTHNSADHERPRVKDDDFCSKWKAGKWDER